MKLMSIIIPVYNAENYLDKTIQSVINQSIGFNNIELILVDDNSSDGSKIIIEKYCNKYDNIIPYYSNKNHGFPGFGRNMGIKMATTDYIMFLDNDDEYDKDICKKLYETLVDENADVVSCGRVLIDYLGQLKDSYYFIGGKHKNNLVIFENDEILSFCSITVWNKIFKKEIIYDNNLKFLENSSADDFAFSVEYHIKSNKLVHLKDYYGYNWNIRGESLSNTIKIQHIEEVLVAYNYIVKKIKKENKLNYSFELLRHMVSLLVLKSSYLDVNYSSFKKILKDIHDFESFIEFDSTLNDQLLNKANKLILSNRYLMSIVYLRVLKHLRKINFLRKIRRKK